MLKRNLSELWILNESQTSNSTLTTFPCLVRRREGNTFFWKDYEDSFFFVVIKWQCVVFVVEVIVNGCFVLLFPRWGKPTRPSRPFLQARSSSLRWMQQNNNKKYVQSQPTHDKRLNIVYKLKNTSRIPPVSSRVSILRDCLQYTSCLLLLLAIMHVLIWTIASQQ